MNEFKNNPEEENQNPGHNDPDSSVTPQKQINPLISPIAAAILGLVGAFVLYQIVGGTITLLIFGKDLKSAPINALRLLTAGGQILFILLPALVFAKWIYEDVSTIIRFKLPDWKEFALFILGIVILTPLLQNYLYIQNYVVAYLAKISPFFQNIKSALDSLDKMIENTYGDLLSTNNFLEGIFVVVIVSIVPAICEETMFRGFIQKSFEFKLKPFWAALITAIFFGLYHFNPYGLIPLIGLGLYFGFAAYTSKSIFIPMTLHFLNNFAAIILYFVFGNDELINSAVESKADLNSTIISFVLLLIVFSGVIVFIKRYYSQVKNI
jgi:uncharacterized protein